MCKVCNGRVPGMSGYNSWDRPDDLWAYMTHPLHSERLTNGCLVWKGGHNRCGGYGLLRIAPKYESVHRIAYKLKIGRIPIGCDVLHKCYNPSCFEPMHLFVGDGRKHRRGVLVLRGSDHVGAKLTWEDVGNIRRAYAAGELNQYELAAMYGVKQCSISDVIHWRTWREVTSRESIRAYRPRRRARGRVT